MISNRSFHSDGFYVFVIRCFESFQALLMTMWYSTWVLNKWDKNMRPNDIVFLNLYNKLTAILFSEVEGIFGAVTYEAQNGYVLLTLSHSRVQRAMCSLSLYCIHHNNLQYLLWSHHALHMSCSGPWVGVAVGHQAVSSRNRYMIAHCGPKIYCCTI